MISLFLYLLKTVLIAGILLGYYWIGLRNTRFHYYNRFYLVGTVLLSLLLPLLDLQWFTLTTPSTHPIQQVVEYIYSPPASSQADANFTWEQILGIVLLLISVLLVCFLIYGIIKVYMIKSRGKITVMERFDFIETSLDDAPFSFFRNLFWRKDLPLYDETGQRMLKHELTHIEQFHSLDKLLVALATYIFWMNPFFWLIRKELEVVHEFIADEEAVEEDDAAVLAEMLLKTHYHSSILSVGQSFFYSSIKRRIIMLTSSKKVSYSYARRLLILPVAIGILTLLSFTIKSSLSDLPKSGINEETIVVSKVDTIPKKYRDAKTGKIKGSYQIDIDGDIASFKDIKSKKELFKVPLHELAEPSDKVVSIQGFPLSNNKKLMFIAADSVEVENSFIAVEEITSVPSLTTPRIIINGAEVSPSEINKIDPSSIKRIDIRNVENGVAIAANNAKEMTRIETMTEDGKKVVIVKADRVLVDTSTLKNSTDNAKKSTVNTVIFQKSNAKNEERSEKDPKTLTITTNGKDDKNTYVFVQKSKANAELPKDMLYIIDGKEVESDILKEFDPGSIKMINVLKGEAAIKKYGDKANHGVIEITSKK